MPWWVWLILALFMLSMIGIGIVYALIHGYRALKTIGGVGERIGRPLAAMSEAGDVSPEGPQPPLFTQPLDIALSRYRDAQAEKMRRQSQKRERHARQWAVWSKFNE